MVTDEIRERRPEDRSPNDRLDRGQIILIGAVALAFIILGVVVVFNGVLYTETLSSAGTGQSASSAETTELEVRQGIACLIADNDDGDLADTLNSGDLEEDIESYTVLYRNATAHSEPTVVNVEVVDPINSTSIDTIIGNSITVRITSDSNDLSYDRKLVIDAAECPS